MILQGLKARALAFSSTRIRKARRQIPGPLKTTQIFLAAAIFLNLKKMRVTQISRAIVARNNSKRLRTTQVVRAVAVSS